MPGTSGRTAVPGTSGRTAVPGASGRTWPDQWQDPSFWWPVLSPAGFFFCQNVRLRIVGPAFGQILSDFVKFVSDFARFGQIWTASKPASTTKSDWAGKRQTEPRQAGARLGLPVRLARKSARLAFDYPGFDTSF